MNTPERAPTPEPVTPDLEEARKVLMRSHDCFEWIARCQDELSAFEAAAIAKGRAEERQASNAALRASSEGKE